MTAVSLANLFPSNRNCGCRLSVVCISSKNLNWVDSSQELLLVLILPYRNSLLFITLVFGIAWIETTLGDGFGYYAVCVNWDLFHQLPCPLNYSLFQIDSVSKSNYIDLTCALIFLDHQYVWPTWSYPRPFVHFYEKEFIPPFFFLHLFSFASFFYCVFFCIFFPITWHQLASAHISLLLNLVLPLLTILSH